MNIFHVAEIIDMGIEKEIKRRDFYAMVAAHFSEPKLRSLFERLRDWESTHIERFVQLRKQAEDLESSESREGEMRDYMRALVDEKLYAQVTPEDFKRIVKTPGDAIVYGIHFERDAILFFSELAVYITGPAAGPLKELIDEERSHILYLSRLRDELGV